MTSNQISPEAEARREAARQGGKFGEQQRSAPDSDILTTTGPDVQEAFATLRELSIRVAAHAGLDDEAAGDARIESEDVAETLLGWAEAHGIDVVEARAAWDERSALLASLDESEDPEAYWDTKESAFDVAETARDAILASDHVDVLDDQSHDRLARQLGARTRLPGGLAGRLDVAVDAVVAGEDGPINLRDSAQDVMDRAGLQDVESCKQFLTALRPGSAGGKPGAMVRSDTAKAVQRLVCERRNEPVTTALDATGWDAERSFGPDGRLEVRDQDTLVTFERLPKQQGWVAYAWKEDRPAGYTRPITDAGACVQQARDLLGHPSR